METGDTTVGIDLGTTNSLIGTVTAGKLVLFRDASNAELLPSVVGMDPNGAIIVGRSARNRRWVAPEKTAVSVKRQMGTEDIIRVGTKQLTAPQVSALILSTLLDRAEQTIGKRPSRAVITVPAYFDDRQREATRLAGELAGLKVERLVNEPTAAAMCYQTGGEALVLVYDFGGGTFDVSVLERDEGFLEVRASHGDTHLGGDDIDRALFELVLERAGSDRKRIESDPSAQARLMDAVERAKITLSTAEDVKLSEPFLAGSGDNAIHLEQVLSRADLEQVVEPFVQRTLDCIDATLRDAHLSASALDRVILVGGSSRIPFVGRRVGAHLERPVLMDENVDRAVALGAAMLAGRADGQQVADVLVDVTPHTLACGAIGDTGPNVDEEDLMAAEIIERNTVVPVERSRTLYTMLENQPAVEIPVVQGEGATVGENTWLGLVRIEDLPSSPALSPVDVTFRLDLSGVLTVRAKHVPSGMDAKVTFANSPYHLTAQRRETQRSEVEALRAIAAVATGQNVQVSDTDRKLGEALISRAQRSLAQAAAGTVVARDRVQHCVTELSTALTGGDQDVASLIDELADALLDLA